MSDDDDNWGIDGDASVPFQARSGGMPWLSTGIPPWHMWGNSQTIGPIEATSSDALANYSPGQLAKISYKRPETWHWVFAARILDVTPSPPGIGATARITVNFDLTIGVGRAQVQLLGFDTFSWVWQALINPPYSHVMWATSTRTPALGYVLSGGNWIVDPTTVRDINQFEAQDIQLTTRVDFFQSGWAEETPPRATVEVSAFFAPKVHVRPDWLLKGPPELMFGGGETQGK